MSADLLLFWMSHLGEGSWNSFKSTVGKLVGMERDVDGACRALRVVLSDLGYADFFVDDSQRWRTLPPVLAGLPMRQAAVLTGARTPALLDSLVTAADQRSCELAIVGNGALLPVQVRLEGPRDALASVAAEIGIAYMENFALQLCAAVDPIPNQLAAAPEEFAPANWSVRSFDFSSFKWVEGLRSRSACEFSSRYGPKRFFVHTRRSRLIRLPKRAAVYAAAMLRGIALASYDTAEGILSSPVSTPLPEFYARIACLCAGLPASVRHGALTYQCVPRDVGAVLLVAAGQAYPDAHHMPIAAPEVVERVDGQPI